ncbi:hypothetical protein [uncultured Algibacter sp.]|uniref:hypothetical protein n=1 Tax=uncultured Algibacter sp. TaxID=298659 RepID=UPI00261B058A|nr:hypothetical protein [uncultured Algibacter sp.]
MIELRTRIIKFLDSKKQFPIIAAVAAGLYPLLFYYNTNFTLVNSWTQFAFFLACYIVIPIIIFIISYALFKKFDKGGKYISYVIPVLNFTAFTYFVILSTYGFKNKWLFLFLLAVFFLAILIKNHINKIIVFQFLLALFVFIKLLPDFHKVATYSATWQEQPDNIEDVIFKKKPNIYIIQPDGYANFSELKKGYYSYNNSSFENFLKDENFKLYNNYRSNYGSTLSSNSSMFSMKHHYYNNTTTSSKELYNTREIIVGDNPVISILKKNNYKNFLLLERPYLLVNRPKVGYDYCNIDFSEISFLARGFEIEKEVISELEHAITENVSTNNFYFIGLMRPSHISVNKNESKGIKKERETYLKDLEKANKSLKEILKIIKEKDTNSLIAIVADHGGFIGLNYSMETHVKQTERDIIYSIYTSALAIKWPDSVPSFDVKLNTSVNLFRVLFSYLSENESYLNYLEKDKSFALIKEDAPYGVYEYIDENGNTIFNKYKE